MTFYDVRRVALPAVDHEGVVHILYAALAPKEVVNKVWFVTVPVCTYNDHGKEDLVLLHVRWDLPYTSVNCLRCLSDGRRELYETF